MDTYAERLAAAMEKAGKDRNGLAAAVGISYHAVRKVLLGESNGFSAENNSKAAKALNVSPDWLATGEGPMQPKAIASLA